MGNSQSTPKFVLNRLLRRHRYLGLPSKSSSFGDYLFALVALLVVLAMVLIVVRVLFRS